MHGIPQDALSNAPSHAGAEAMAEGSPGSPPKRKGKGGRQRAPPPDATVDPKKAKRIMANRESAARSKEKQKKNAEVRSLMRIWERSTCRS